MGFLRRLLGKAAAATRFAPGRDSLPPPSRPDRFGVDELARRLGVPAARLRETAVSYRTFSIPKRSGRSRVIAAPDAPLKELQRLILRRVLSRLRAHPSVTGFERAHSIATNAKFHTGQAVIIRMDIREFFPSTLAGDVQRFFARLGWDAPAAALLTRLCTHEGRLPQGAPTSPRLSTLVNYPMDVRLQGAADRLHARYTRYADDLTFSLEADSQGRVHKLVSLVKWTVEQFGYQLHMKRKLHIRRRHQRQEVTGLVVNRRVALPRSTRRWLRAVEHRLRTGRQATLTAAQVNGWRSLCHMIDAQGGEPPATHS